MDGILGVESIPGEGSTFWIELPQCESQLERAEKTGKFGDLGSKLIHNTGTILYIEDNTSNIELVEQILSNQRPSIHLITNIYGRQALRLAIENLPDLILLDLNLPDIHGKEVIRLLQVEEKTRSIPVVIISADATPLQLEKLLEAGARKYLTKPLDVLELLQVIDQFIQIQPV
jgi:CheY-like chemotaxis protein